MKQWNKIRWQCRRGSLELDLLLKKYLETRYETASAEEQMRFVAWLQLDDEQLLAIMQQFNFEK